MKQNMISRHDAARADKLAAFDRLLTIMDELRDNCPWDKKQTYESLRPLTIEETYELSQAIINQDLNEIKKEAGDLLLHIVFYARLGQETGSFDMESIINSLCEKLISRHPHIYSDAIADDEQTVKQNWEALKLKEGNISALSGVPNALPSMIKAWRIQEKAKSTGFDWDKPEQVWDKVSEELSELQAEVLAAKPDKEKMTDELGDVFFSLINYARFLNINPDEALERTNRKFIKRFEHVQAAVIAQGLDMQKMNLEELEIYWRNAKKMENK